MSATVDALGTDLATILSRRVSQCDVLLKDAAAKERRADEHRYSLLSVLKRLFDDDSCPLTTARKDALRIALLAAADRGSNHYDMSLGFNSLHPLTIASINNPVQFVSATQYLCVEVLGSSRLQMCYRDDTDECAHCTVPTRPTLRISWNVLDGEGTVEPAAIIVSHSDESARAAVDGTRLHRSNTRMDEGDTTPSDQSIAENICNKPIAVAVEQRKQQAKTEDEEEVLFF